jgi:hypothetical protein
MTTEDTMTWKSSKSFGLSVILAGLVTSAITLGIVYALSRVDVSVMGFYVMPYIPVGAIIAGLAAGSGYAIATWKQGIKVTAALCALVVVLQLGCYFTAEYIDYAQAQLTYEDGTAVGFWEYFDYTTRSFTFKEENHKPSGPLGAWGYGLRALEILGFGLGGLIGAIVLRAKPYCDECGVYMRSRQLGVVPASIPARKIGKNKQQEQQQYEAEQAQAAEKARAVLAALAESAQQGDDRQFRRTLEEGGVITEKQAMKLPLSFRVALVYCRDCANGRLVASSLTRVKNQTAVAEANRWDLDPAFIARLEQFQPRRLAAAGPGGPR